MGETACEFDFDGLPVVLHYPRGSCKTRAGQNTYQPTQAGQKTIQAVDRDVRIAPR